MRPLINCFACEGLIPAGSCSCPLCGAAKPCARAGRLPAAALALGLAVAPGCWRYFGSEQSEYTAPVFDTGGDDTVPNDADGDGLSDDDESWYNTDPHNPDTDGDGLSDGEEVDRVTDPLKADTDGDGLDDGLEVALGTDPSSQDTDGDGLTDGLEISIGTDPLKRDTDGGGVEDGAELAAGTDPLNGADDQAPSEPGGDP